MAGRLVERDRRDGVDRFGDQQDYRVTDVVGFAQEGAVVVPVLDPERPTILFVPHHKRCAVGSFEPVGEVIDRNPPPPRHIG